MVRDKYQVRRLCLFFTILGTILGSFLTEVSDRNSFNVGDCFIWEHNPSYGGKITRIFNYYYEYNQSNLDYSMRIKQLDKQAYPIDCNDLPKAL